MEETEEETFMSKHLDSLSTWHEEAEKMRELRFLSPNEDMQINYSKQVVEILESMVDSGAFDVRSGWLGQENLWVLSNHLCHPHLIQFHPASTQPIRLQIWDCDSSLALDYNYVLNVMFRAVLFRPEDTNLFNVYFSLYWQGS